MTTVEFRKQTGYEPDGTFEPRAAKKTAASVMEDARESFERSFDDLTLSIVVGEETHEATVSGDTVYVPWSVGGTLDDDNWASLKNGVASYAGEPSFEAGYLGPEDEDDATTPTVDEDKTAVVESLTDEIRGVGKTTAQDLYESGVRGVDDLLTGDGELSETAADAINPAFHEKARNDARAEVGYEVEQSTSVDESTVADVDTPLSQQGNFDAMERDIHNIEDSDDYDIQPPEELDDPEMEELSGPADNESQDESVANLGHFESVTWDSDEAREFVLEHVDDYEKGDVLVATEDYSPIEEGRRVRVYSGPEHSAYGAGNTNTPVARKVDGVSFVVPVTPLNSRTGEPLEEFTTDVGTPQPLNPSLRTVVEDFEPVDSDTADTTEDTADTGEDSAVEEAREELEFKFDTARDSYEVVMGAEEGDELTWKRRKRPVTVTDTSASWDDVPAALNAQKALYEDLPIIEVDGKHYLHGQGSTDSFHGFEYSTNSGNTRTDAIQVELVESEDAADTDDEEVREESEESLPDELTDLPGVGEKTAEKAGLGIVESPEELRKKVLQGNWSVFQNVSTQYVGDILDELGLSYDDVDEAVIAVAEGWRVDGQNSGTYHLKHRDVNQFRLSTYPNHVSVEWFEEMTKYGANHQDIISTNDMTKEEFVTLLRALAEDWGQFDANKQYEVEEKVDSFLERSDDPDYSDRYTTVNAGVETEDPADYAGDW